jgi:hypothetical protein
MMALIKVIIPDHPQSYLRKFCDAMWHFRRFSEVSGGTTTVAAPLYLRGREAAQTRAVQLLTPLTPALRVSLLETPFFPQTGWYDVSLGLAVSDNSQSLEVSLWACRFKTQVKTSKLQ